MVINFSVLKLSEFLLKDLSYGYCSSALGVITFKEGVVMNSW